MLKAVFYIGTADKKELKQVKSDAEFLGVFDYLFKEYTLQEAQGRYTMRDTKEVVTEKTFIVTVYTDAPLFNVHSKVEYLKTMLNQESIGLELTRGAEFHCL